MQAIFASIPHRPATPPDLCQQMTRLLLHVFDWNEGPKKTPMDNQTHVEQKSKGTAMLNVHNHTNDVM